MVMAIVILIVIARAALLKELATIVSRIRVRNLRGVGLAADSALFSDGATVSQRLGGNWPGASGSSADLLCDQYPLIMNMSTVAIILEI